MGDNCKEPVLYRCQSQAKLTKQYLNTVFNLSLGRLFFPYLLQTPVKDPKELLSVISPGEAAHKTFVEEGYRILNLAENKYANYKSLIKTAETPYIFFANEIFKFDETDANFHRMIREAESQNADVVTGAFREIDKIADQAA